MNPKVAPIIQQELQKLLEAHIITSSGIQIGLPMWFQQEEEWKDPDMYLFLFNVYAINKAFLLV
jgi:hypothetical protein